MLKVNLFNLYYNARHLELSLSFPIANLVPGCMIWEWIITKTISNNPTPPAHVESVIPLLPSSAEVGPPPTQMHHLLLLKCTPPPVEMHVDPPTPAQMHPSSSWNRPGLLLKMVPYLQMKHMPPPVQSTLLQKKMSVFLTLSTLHIYTHTNIHTQM